MDIDTRNYSASGRRTNKWIVRAVITVGLLAGLSIALTFSVGFAGMVSGVEFSPDTFTSRTFIYYEVPLVRMQISPVFRGNASGALEQILSTDKQLVPNASVPTPRWCLVTMTKGRATYTDDALIVHRYLDVNQSGDHWQIWTNDHPKLAKVLWPAVAEVCRRDLFTFTPDLFDVANQMTVPKGAKPAVKEFEAAIANSLADQYISVGDLSAWEEQYDDAIEKYTWALKRLPGNLSALRGRAAAHIGNGDTAKAKIDRDRIREIQSQQ